VPGGHTGAEPGRCDHTFPGGGGGPPPPGRLGRTRASRLAPSRAAVPELRWSRISSTGLPDPPARGPIAAPAGCGSCRPGSAPHAPHGLGRRMGATRLPDFAGRTTTVSGAPPGMPRCGTEVEPSSREHHRMAPAQLCQAAVRLICRRADRPFRARRRSLQATKCRRTELGLRGSERLCNLAGGARTRAPLATARPWRSP